MGKVLATPVPRYRYQLETLLRTHFLGRKLSHLRDRKPWCFYVVWPAREGEAALGEPYVQDVASIVAEIGVNSREASKPPSSFRLKGGLDRFRHVLSEGLTRTNSHFGLRLRLQCLPAFLEETGALLPTLNLMASSATESGGQALAAALRRGNFNVSGPLLARARRFAAAESLHPRY